MIAIPDKVQGSSEPQIEFAGAVELSDTAIEALAALLLELAEMEPEEATT